MIGGQIVLDAVEENIEEQLTLHSAGGVEPWHTLSTIVAWRRQCTGCKETGLWALDLMQDDLGYVAVTREVGKIVRDTIPLVLGSYGISVSMAKRAEDEAIVGEPPHSQTSACCTSGQITGWNSRMRRAYVGRTSHWHVSRKS